MPDLRFFVEAGHQRAHQVDVVPDAVVFAEEDPLVVGELVHDVVEWRAWVGAPVLDQCLVG